MNKEQEQNTQPEADTYTQRMKEIYEKRKVVEDKYFKKLIRTPEPTNEEKRARTHLVVNGWSLENGQWIKGKNFYFSLR